MLFLRYCEANGSIVQEVFQEYPLAIQELTRWSQRRHKSTIQPSEARFIRLGHYHPRDEMKRHSRAFIYLATSLGREAEVAEALWKLEEVKEVHIIPGRYDILAVVEVSRHLLEPDSQSIYWFILERIREISGIADTETLIPIVSMSRWSN